MKYVVSTLLLGGASTLFAQNVLPTKLPLRTHGLIQYRAPSCQSEAEATALEYAFAERNMPVLISPWHRHLKVWEGKNLAGVRTYELNGADQAAYNATGSIIPDYMWPGGDYRQGWTVGWRPRISEMAQIDFSFPTDAQTGFDRQYKSWGRDANGRAYSNTSDINSLKSLIRAKDKQGITLSLHSVLLSKFFDHTTGILKSNDVYTKSKMISYFDQTSESSDFDRFAEFEKAARESKGLWSDEADEPRFVKEINHAVAVVGYLERFYDGVLPVTRDNGEPTNTDAIIIRNSWNTEYDVYDNANAKDTAALERLRYPLYRSMSGTSGSQNLSGYYAIPVAYLQDLVNYKWEDGSGRTGTGGFYVTNLKYFEVFYEAYNRFAAQYSMKKVPFVCGESGKNRAKFDISDFGYYIANGDRNSALEIAKEDAVPGYGLKFRLAQIPQRNGDTSMVQKFLNGGFDSYYCSTNENVVTSFEQSWPGIKQFQTAPVWQGVEKISSISGSVLSWSSYYKALSDAKADSW
jgi:hypothetical protein